MQFTVNLHGFLRVLGFHRPAPSTASGSFSFYLNGHVIGQIGNDGTDKRYATLVFNGSVDGTGPFREGSSSGATFAGAGSFRCGEWRIFGGYAGAFVCVRVSGGEVGGPGDNYIKRGSWLMQDIEQVIRDAPPYAYPHDEWLGPSLSR